MKINEKNLYTFANSKPVDKEGELGVTFRVDSHRQIFQRPNCFIRIHFLTFDFNFFFLHVQGFLQFKREMKFQKRWFVLKGNLLFYFDKKGDKEPVGLLLLEGCKRDKFKKACHGCFTTFALFIFPGTVELTADEDSQQFCFELVFHGENNRTYYMGASTQNEMESWMKSLTTVSHNFVSQFATLC